MNRYPLWKYLVLIVVLLLGVLYALPNVFGEDPAVQVATTDGEPPAEDVRERIVALLAEAGIAIEEAGLIEERFLVRLESQEAQLEAADLIKEALGDDYVVALNLAADTPAWLRGINARPMYLGLDLRGGVHFLMEVDLEAALLQRLESTLGGFRSLLRESRIRYEDIGLDDGTLRVAFDEAAERERAFRELRRRYPELAFDQDERAGLFWISATISEQAAKEIQDEAVAQNISTLRNRVNELGVAEPIIQRQGVGRIVVQLPGVQDPAAAKEILGTTATLEFRLVHPDAPPNPQPGDRLPPGAELFPMQDGSGYVALDRDVIVTGEHITDADAGIDPEGAGPQVSIELTAPGGELMRRATQENVGRPLATVFIEDEVRTERVDGELKRTRTRVEEVISVANIQEPFGARFRVTGLDSTSEAHELALLLRAGSLAAPMVIVEERTIGPSLGAQNIEQGRNAVVLGFVLVVIFMALYYKVFGLIADLALFANLVLMVAVLSLLQATLTLPGIAGIVLTVGMAVDANVLIFQRIREELKAGAGPQAAIRAGYDKALSSIADGQLTTLIAAIVLFAFGTGPIKGFAVTLSIGIATSLFTSIMGTRAVVNLVYGGRRVQRLHI